MAKRVNRDPIDTIISNYHYANAIYRSGCKIFPIPCAFDISPLPLLDFSISRYRNRSILITETCGYQASIASKQRSKFDRCTRVYSIYIYIYNEIHTVKSRTIWLGRQMEINQCPIPSRCPHKYWFPIGRERNLCRGVCRGPRACEPT